MPDASGQFQGWMLAEAIRRTVDSKLLLKWFEAERALRQCGPMGPHLISAGIFADIETEQAAARAREKKRRLNAHRAASASTCAEVVREFYSQLKACRIIARGRRGGPTAEEQPIPASAWNSLRIVNLRRSIVEERTRDKVRIYDVRLYPVVEAQDTVDHSGSVESSRNIMEASVPHAPWPENGCTLGEARERTADREAWKEWRRLNDRRKTFRPRSWLDRDTRLEEVRHDRLMGNRLQETIDECENRITTDSLQHMRTKRLIAYGRPGELSAAPQLIAAEIWPALTNIGWEASAVGENRRGGAVFLAVQVYPALLAPCRTDLVAGRSLSDAFRKYVLEDPEFTALAEHAARQNPEARSIVKEGQAGGADNDWRWPVELSRFSSLTDVINGRRSFWDKQAMADESYRDAYEVLWDRYKHLLNLLKSGDVLVKGTHAGTGHVVGIDVAQWSRRGLWLDVRSGDLLEEENQKLVLKWTGLALEKANKLFHVEPTVSDDVLPTANEQQFALKKAGIDPNLQGADAHQRRRKSPVADAVANALRAHGLDGKQGPLTCKEIASLIAPNMPRPPKTGQQLQALAKAVERHYERCR